jgi:two-component system, cell cycle sensor histidine kinase and response regulator CckA
MPIPHDSTRTASRLKAVLDLVPDCIKLLDREGRLLEMNRAGLAILGLGEVDALLGEDVSALVAPEHRDDFRALTHAVFEGQAGRLTFQIIRPDGGRRWMQTSAVPLRSGDVVDTMLCVTRDITDQVELEHRLGESQKMQAIGQLAGGIAHDFNNLLTVIQGQATLLLLDPRHDSSTVSAAREIADSAERASHLTRQLLAFSRRGVKQPRLLDLGQLAAKTTGLLRRLVGEHIVVEGQYAPEPAIVFADGGMLEQVMLNLAVNARDAMPTGGRLTIEVDTVASMARLRVSDTGSGIDPDALPRIFEPFFTTKAPGAGTGLGLATVFGIVQQHNGRIEVDSKVGRGTTFTILLPMVSHAPLPARESEPLDVSGGSETILLVEDEESVRALARAVLERYGYRVIEAESGAEARTVWERYGDQIELLLTDVRMPGGVSGIEIAREFQRAKPELRVVYTTGYSEDIVTGQIDIRHNLNFLQKPFLLVDLAAVVRRSLDSQDCQRR